MHHTTTISTVASGRVRLQVVDAKTKRVKRDYGWQKNLILNSGMNLVGTTYAWSDMMYAAAAGTGTVPTMDDSGDTVASQDASTVTLSGGSFAFTSTAVDAGNYIKWDTGEEARIVTVASPSSVTVHTTASIGAGEFKVYRTNQTLLSNQVKRTVTRLSGGTSYDLANSRLTFTRIWDFTPETGPITYTEVGVSYAITLTAELFSRILLQTPVACVAEEGLRLHYDLTLTLSPCTQRPVSLTIPDWGEVTGVEILEEPGLLPVDADGSTPFAFYQRGLEPSVAGQLRVQLSDSTEPIRTQTSAVFAPAFTGSTMVQDITLSTYASLSFTRTKTVVFTPSDGTVMAVRSICIVGWTYSSVGDIYRNFTIRLDQPFNKLNTHKLTLSFKINWSRTLS